MLAVDCAEAFIYSEHRVLGKKLKPFCLYHHFILDAIESPLSRKGEEADITDLYIGVILCSQSFPLDFSKLPKAATPLSIIWYSLKISYLLTRYKTSREMLRFANYVRDYTSMPTFWQSKENGTKPTGIPDVLTLVTTLILKLGFKENEAWNCPLGKAVWLCTSAGIVEGAESKIITPEAKAFMQNLGGNNVG